MLESPVLRFGLLTDVQHALKETASFEGRPQRYKESAGKLKAAVEHLRQLHEEQPLAFLLTCGDIVDGYPASDSNAETKTSRDLQLVVGTIRTALQPLPVHHVLGNHCLRAARQELLGVLDMPGSYYSAEIGKAWRLIVLDTTEMSLHSGYPKDSEQMQQARAWLAAHPVQQYPNAVSWNGGLTKQQMSWLQQELDSAKQHQQHVVVACHHPLAPGSAPDHYLAWDNGALMQELERHPGLVKLVLCGHYHPGGYSAQNGIHYVVFEGILEAPPESNAYGVVEVSEDRMNLQGYGVGTSRQLLFS